MIAKKKIRKNRIPVKPHVQTRTVRRSLRLPLGGRYGKVVAHKFGMGRAVVTVRAVLRLTRFPGAERQPRDTEELFISGFLALDGAQGKQEVNQVEVAPESWPKCGGASTVSCPMVVRSITALGYHAARSRLRR